MYNVLHITNDYSGSSVYMNLIHELDVLGISQLVYTPIRNEKYVGKNVVDFINPNSKILYRPILNNHIDRIFYPFKIKKILDDIQKQVDFSKIDFIHAHTWYSDGGVAYELSKKYGIPFIVTIRNTDINVFQKKLRYLRPYGSRILEKAQRVILISAAYKDRILAEYSVKPILTQLSKKIEVIPNGVNSFWIENAINKRLDVPKSFKFLYVGKFNTGKNVLNLVKAIYSLNIEGCHCTLELVGGGGEAERKILTFVNRFQNIFNYHGQIHDKETLMKVMKFCDVFAMPSRNETFGLVYIEAMLQGLPILYTEGEGVDGFYRDRIGEKVRKNANAKEIASSLKVMMKDFKKYYIPTKNLLNNHDWSLIALKYKNIYES